jgi:hypothetical protein
MKPLEHLANDPFFRWSEDSEWNACIGPQGHEENYADGYVEAAALLADVVIERELHISRDTLVLPILYNARHAIELTLKFVISRLHGGGLLHDPVRPNHDIAIHFEKLVCAKLADWELRSQLKKLAPFVESLAAIDVDGQQLRYATDQAGNSSLEERPLANLEVIRSSLAELSAVLKNMKARTRILCEENETGTFTSRCSRSDLAFIAKEVGRTPNFASAEFRQTKDRLKERFELGSKHFQDAIDIIKKSTEMGVYLGEVYQLHSLTDEHAIAYVNAWTKLHPPREDGALGSRIVKSSELAALILNSPPPPPVATELMSVLSIDELVDVETIFYLGRDGTFPEYYESAFRSTKREYEVAKDMRGSVQHILSKTNLLKCLSLGIRRLGRPKLADELAALRPDLLLGD